MNCTEQGAVYSLQGGPLLPKARAECRHLGEQLAIFYTSLANEARQLGLKLQHRLDAVLVIYYLDSRGEAGLKNFMHAFCKANGCLWGIQSPVWEKNERVLDSNASCSVSLSCLFQTCQDLKGNLRVFCHFFHHTRIEMLLIRFSGASNADNFIRCSSLLCLLNSGFLPLFLRPSNSFRVVIFYR